MIYDPETGHREATIVINGRTLSYAESMSVRVSVTSFRIWLSDPDNAKDIGERLASAYDVHLSNVEAMLVSR